MIEDLTAVYDEYASPFTKRLLKEDGGLAMKASAFGGKLYALPLTNSNLDEVSMLWVRDDWMKRLNLPEPTTMDGMIAIAKAFTEQDPDGNGKDEVIADFGSLGLRAFYNNAAPWVKLDTRNPTNAIAADLDSNGKGEVVADFGASGLFVRFNNTGAFRQLRAWPSQAIAAGGFD